MLKGDGTEAVVYSINATTGKLAFVFICMPAKPNPIPFKPALAHLSPTNNETYSGGCWGGDGDHELTTDRETHEAPAARWRDKD